MLELFALIVSKHEKALVADFFYSSHKFSVVSVGLTLRISSTAHMVPLEMTHNHKGHSIQNSSCHSYGLYLIIT